MLTKSPKEAPDKSVDVTIGFEKSMPVSVNGKRALSAVMLLEELNAIGAAAGIGRIDLVENRFVGMKSRGCYETPGGTLIMVAHHELESLTLDKSMAHYKEKLALDYAEMVYNGLWFTPLRESLDAFFEKAAETTTGEVTLRLYKGGIQPVSRKSPYSLYSLNIASFTMGAEYDQKDARGFINLIGLPIQVRASIQKAREEGRMKLWGGRFEAGPSEVFERFSGSLHFDKRLFDVDIRGSIAYAGALERVGILTAQERDELAAAFQAIQKESAAPAFWQGADDEDVHTLVIRKLKERAGTLADKIHTGRSRNDQVSLDIRLWLREEIDADFERIACVDGGAARYGEARTDTPSCRDTRIPVALSRCCGRITCSHISKCSHAIWSV